MFGAEELKDEIKITKTKVECPVKGCSEEVDRKYRKDTHKYTAEFQCRKDNIFISPSTFVYPNVSDNLLWKERSDLEILKRLKTSKRNNRMAHDNSEDAVSWNVFRFLERNNLIEGMLRSITDISPKSSEVIYWSYSQREGKCWSLLDEARKEFEGEKLFWSSEPDIIVNTDSALFFIEAKLTARNKDSSLKKKDSTSRSKRLKKYLTGGDNWFFKVVQSDFETVAFDEGLYELLRFWILGTWMADQQDLDFYLINLVRDEEETKIESLFNSHIKENERRKFKRVTWERIYQFISNEPSVRDTEKMMRCFRNKTIGYTNGKLQKAFPKL